MYSATFRLVRSIAPEPKNGSLLTDPLFLEIFWLPILGPAATMLLRRFRMYLEVQPDGVSIDLNDIGRELGIGTAEGKHAPVRRALSRLLQFGLVARQASGQIEVPNVVKDMPTHQLPRVIEAIRPLCRRWVSDERVGVPDLPANGPLPREDPTGD
jgi:hypothetical protein